MSSDGYWGDFGSFAEEQEAYREWEEQQYIDEHGACPNCNATVHISELGDENGVVCCMYCYEHEREKQNLPQWNEAKTEERIKILKLSKII